MHSLSWDLTLVIIFSGENFRGALGACQGYQDMGMLNVEWMWGIDKPEEIDAEACPSIDEINNFVHYTFTNEACVLREMGWMDWNYNIMDWTFDYDITLFPAPV